MQKKKEHLKTNQSSKIGQSFGVIKFEFCKLTFCVLKAFCICGLWLWFEGGNWGLAIF